MPTGTQPPNASGANYKADATADAPNSDAAEPGPPHIPGQVRLPSSSAITPGRMATAGSETRSRREPGNPRAAQDRALAAVVALAVIAGALGRTLATTALTRHCRNDAATSSDHVLDATVARIDADVSR